MIVLGPLLAIQVAAPSPLSGMWDRFRPNYDALRYDISLTLPATDSVFSATVRAEWKRLRPGALWIDLDSVLTVRSVSLNDKPARWRREGNRITVTVPPGRGTIRTSVRYDGLPVDGLIIRGSGADRTIFADNWPDRGRHWLAVQDHPADKALVSWTVDAPAGCTVVATGTLEGVDSASPGRVRWRFRIAEPVPTYTMVVGAARFAVTPQRSGVSVYTYPQDSATALSGPFRRSAEIMEFFAKRIGPFPYEGLRHVQSSTRFGGMENATAIFYDEKSMHAGRMTEGTVAHETAHQWFGDAVTEADWHHIWLSEGFATYGAALWSEHAGGDSALRADMRRTRDEVIASAATEQPILDSTVTERMRLLNTNSYQKGGWVLHSLRGLIGDSAFFRGLRRYAATYRHRNALSRDFARIMSEAAGQNLEWYFRQALTRPGYPILEAHTDLEAGHLTVTITQVQKPAWGLYRLPNLQVRLGTRVITVPVTGRVTTVATHWDGATPPAGIELDPGTWWLFAPRSTP